METILTTALLVAFLILLASKTGLRDYLIERAPKLLSKLVACDFCLSFWIAFIVSIVMYVDTKDISALMIPLFSTPLTRILL